MGKKKMFKKVAPKKTQRVSTTPSPPPPPLTDSGLNNKKNLLSILVIKLLQFIIFIFVLQNLTLKLMVLVLLKKPNQELL